MIDTIDKFDISCLDWRDNLFIKKSGYNVFLRMNDHNVTHYLICG